MNAVVLFPTAPIRPIDAAAINEAHRHVVAAGKNAIAHAIRAGQLLLQQKLQVPHGAFQRWIEEHCEFKYATAARYMKAADQKSTGVEISSLSQLFPSGRAGRPSAARRAVTKAATSADLDADGGGVRRNPVDLDLSRAISILKEHGPRKRGDVLSELRADQLAVKRFERKLDHAKRCLADSMSAVISAAADVLANGGK